MATPGQDEAAVQEILKTLMQEECGDSYLGMDPDGLEGMDEETIESIHEYC